MLNITFEDGTACQMDDGATLEDLALKTNGGGVTVVGALVDRAVWGLDRALPGDCTVAWLHAGTRQGARLVRRSLSFMLVKAARELFPDARLLILHALNRGYFCELRRTGNGQTKPLLLRRNHVERLQRHMEAQREACRPFVREEMPREEAMALFEFRGRDDLVRLLRNLSDTTVDVHRLDDEVDYFHGDLAPHTGLVGPFELHFYPPGFLLRFPEDTAPDVIAPFVDTARLNKVFYEFKMWADVLEVPDVGQLNEVVAGGDINDFIRVAEALHEKKMAQIADAIDQDRGRIKLVLIAGPSASGKTTFAQRLAVQLRVNGLKPIPISLDDYYVEREATPLDENGEYDFECVDAIDMDLLNDHLQRLTWGEAVRLPRYNFITGKREFRRTMLQLRPGELLVMEGIHALNERLTESIARGNKYKVYISALTQLNLDDHNRMPTTDTRLLRRIARDMQFRGYDALATLGRWRSVRRGEEKNIFPFQEEADVMFNSGLFYEVGVLRGIVEPLLEEVPVDYPEHVEARRLLRLVSHFLPVGTDEIPPNSILREFIGATCFFRAE